MFNNATFCPGCFRTVNKGFLNLLCPDCELKETVKRESEKTRRLMQEQERRQQKERSIQERQNQISRTQNITADTSAFLNIIPLRHDEIKSFNQEALESIYSGNVSRMEANFHFAKKWKLEDLKVSIRAIKSAEIDKYLTKSFIESLRNHMYIRHLLSLAIIAAKKTTNQELTEWCFVYHSFTRPADYSRHLISFIMSEAIVNEFTEKYDWLRLSVEELDEIVAHMVVIPKWGKACEQIGGILVNRGVSRVKNPKSLLVAIHAAKKREDNQSILIALTSICNQSDEAKKLVLSVKVVEMLANKIKEANNPNFIVESFFQEWSEVSIGKQEIIDHIEKQRSQVDEFVKFEINNRRAAFRAEYEIAYQNYLKVRKQEAEKLKAECQGISRFIYLGNTRYKEIAKAEGEHLEILFDRVRKCDDEKSKTWSSVVFFDLGPCNSTPNEYYFCAVFWLLFAELFHFFGKPVGYTIMLISYWYLFKCLGLGRAQSQIQEINKIENMRFETNRLEDRLAEMREDAQTKRAA